MKWLLPNCICFTEKILKIFAWGTYVNMVKCPNDDGHVENLIDIKITNLKVSHPMIISCKFGTHWPSYF